MDKRRQAHMALGAFGSALLLIGALKMCAPQPPPTSGVDGAVSPPPTRSAPPPTRSATDGPHTPPPGTPSPGGDSSPQSSPRERTPQERKMPRKEKKEDDPRQAAALRFARAYTTTDRPKKAWLRDMRRLSTPRLAEGLSYTALAVVPGSPPTGETGTATRSEIHITMRVPLKSGTALLVTLTPGGCPGRWCADRVAPGAAP